MITAILKIIEILLSMLRDYQATKDVRYEETLNDRFKKALAEGDNIVASLLMAERLRRIEKKRHSNSSGPADDRTSPQ